MFGLILSFVCLITIPCGIVLLIALIRKTYFKKTFPTIGRLAWDIGVKSGITVAITLAISFVFSATGFFDSQFFRPSAKDFGELRKASVDHQECFFESKDGTRLHGYLLSAKAATVNQSPDAKPTPPAAGDSDLPQGLPAKAKVDPPELSSEKRKPGTVIHFHGSDRNISFTLKNSVWLTEYGFNVFVFDYRGYGKSEGKPTRIGVLEDGVAAIEFVSSLESVDPERIVLWGQSMGGQLAINAAVRSGRKDLRAVIAEATYASFSHHVKDKMASMGPLWLMQWSAWLVTSDRYSAKESVGQLGPVSLLLVHGTEDRVVRPYQSDWLLSLANEPKTIWKSNGGNHLNVFWNERNQKLLIDYLNAAFER